jgi:hypothetical protein
MNGQIDIFEALKESMTSYHNTTDLEGPELVSRQVKAVKQDDVVLDVFRRHGASLLSPEMVWNMTGQSCPITSIRRAITNLTKAGHLVKTDQKKLGMYGAKSYLWKYQKS